MLKPTIVSLLIVGSTLLSSSVLGSNELTECKKESIKYKDKGNSKYAWLYVTNSNKQKVEVVIENSWDYQGRKSETKVIKLSSKEEKNVFNFDRVQNPKSKVLSCIFI